ncbi:MAG: DUF2062 domain-containing protein [Sedimenticola sp.]
MVVDKRLRNRDSPLPKHLIKRFAPDHEKIRNHKHLRIFGKLLHDPNLWHLNRRSVAGAFAVGLFWAFIPVPFQMVGAAATAIPTRVNLPISVALVWVTNPITIPPMFYFTYLVGTWLMGIPPVTEGFEMSAGWFEASLGDIWQPLLLGSLLCGIVSAVASYCIMRGLWRLHIVRRYKERKLRRAAR